MTKKFQRPDRNQQRMLARVGVVFLGLLVYRLLGDDRVAAGLTLWAGIVIAGFPVVDRIMVGPRPAREMLQVAVIVLGLGLCAAGTYLAVR